MRASKQARADYALQRALKSNARALKSDTRARLALHCQFVLTRASNAYMEGSSLLGLKRKIQDVENTKSAGDLKRVKHEKN